MKSDKTKEQWPENIPQQPDEQPASEPWPKEFDFVKYKGKFYSKWHHDPYPLADHCGAAAEARIRKDEREKYLANLSNLFTATGKFIGVTTEAHQKVLADNETLREANVILSEETVRKGHKLAVMEANAQVWILGYLKCPTCKCAIHPDQICLDDGHRRCPICDLHIHQMEEIK